MRVLALALLAGSLALAGCGGSSDGTPVARDTYAERGLTLSYPSDWSLAPFSKTNSPARLAIGSYVIPRGATEGDCGGIAAVRRLPSDGVLVLVIDYGDGPGFQPLPDDLDLTSGEFANYDCFGESTAFRFRVGNRDLQAHIALGPEATEESKEQALDVLRSIHATT